jgi:dihydrofolate reductase
MRQVVLSAGVSLDGYIARRDGGVDWLTMDPEIDFNSFMSGIDAVVMGRKTYDIAAGMGTGGGKIETYIFSRTKPPGKGRKGVQFVNRPPAELIAELKARPGKNIWLMGGGELAREFLREDLIDVIWLGVLPVVLGDGIPLFPPGFPQRNFLLQSHRVYKTTGSVELRYVRR